MYTSIRKLILGSVVLLTLVPELSFAVGLPYATARISRTNTYELTLNFRLTNVPDEDFSGLGATSIGTNSTAPKLLTKYLDVCLANSEVTCDDGVKSKVRYNGDASLDQTDDLYLLDEYEIVITSTSTVRENGFSHIDVLYTISNISGEAINGFLEGDWYISLAYKVNEVTQLPFQVGNASVPNYAPQDFSAVSAHKGLLLTWTAIDLEGDGETNTDEPIGVDYLDDNKGVPTVLSSWIFKDELFSETITLKRLFDEADPSSESTTTFDCSITDNNDGTCSINCPTQSVEDYAYLDKDLITANTNVTEDSNFYYNESPISDSSTMITELDFGSKYAVVTQYEINGVQQSSCLTGEPTLNRIFTELTSGKEPEVGNPSCFIATAAYGSSQEEKIDSLRWFRDNYLLNTKFGKAFVSFYYENSPRLADYIKDKPLLKAMVRGALYAPISYVEALQAKPLMTLFTSFLLLLLIPFAPFLIRIKKKSLI